MDTLHYTKDKEAETAILVGLQKQKDKDWEVRDALEELEQLTRTAGVRVLDTITVKLNTVHPATLMGRGKAEELARRVRELAADTVIFDEDLSPAQGRNLETYFGVKVVDRTQVILDIFAQHARTSEGRLQIELAQLQYVRPRLRRMWTHLERQKGGIGLKGPGEQQLELDRRRLDDRMVRIRRELEGVRARRDELRRGRRRHGWALISIVGYTNAGKSTLLNALCGASLYADDKLFATLDPTTRRLDLPNHQPALLTDTVGFIRKLPHGLVESFKATLEEVIEADLLVHVIDASHPFADAQIDAVHDVLRELGAESKPCLYVVNKIDRPEGAARAEPLARRVGRAMAVSARTGEGLEALRAQLADALKDWRPRLRLRIPLSEGKLLSRLRRVASIEQEEYDGTHWIAVARVPADLLGAAQPYAEEAE